MTKYSKNTQKYVKKAVEEFKEGKLKIGRSNKKVKDIKQAIAIGLDEARDEGERVPRKEDDK